MVGSKEEVMEVINEFAKLEEHKNEIKENNPDWDEAENQDNQEN